MDVSAALDLSNEALVITLIIAGPIMVVGMVVGLVISVVQAVTQLQEQTISFVPKIVAMVAAAVFLLPWLTTRTLEYAGQLWGGSPFGP